MYQEYIADKSHLHMNATRWVTLSEFVKHLGRSGIARVDETEKGWFIAWIDNSPQALAKQVSLSVEVSICTAHRNAMNRKLRGTKSVSLYLTSRENGSLLLNKLRRPRQRRVAQSRRVPQRTSTGN